jgi:hypothetical protein
MHVFTDPTSGVVVAAFTVAGDADHYEAGSHLCGYVRREVTLPVELAGELEMARAAAADAFAQYRDCRRQLAEVAERLAQTQGVG